jgi:hypothetical protein
MIYLIIGVFFLFSIFLFERNKGKNSQIFYCLECLILILLAGFRNHIGGDTLGYMLQWKDIPTLSELRDFDFCLSKYQPLWYISNAIAKSIHDDFTTFQFLHAIFVNTSIFVFINRYSEYRFSAVLIYYFMSFLYFNCEILRESMAICIFLFAIPALVKKKWIKYYLLVTIAIFFHLSSFLLYFLPLMKPAFNEKISVKTALCITLILGILLNPYILQYFIQNSFPLATHYYDKHIASGITIKSYIVYSIKCLMLYVLIYIRQRHKIYNPVVDAGIKFCFFFWIFTIFIPSVGGRFSNYFQLFFIIAMADIFWKFRKKELIKRSLIVIFFLITSINYYVRDVTYWTNTKGIRFGELFFPYYSVFEDVPEEILNRRQAIYFHEE